MLNSQLAMKRPRIIITSIALALLASACQSPAPLPEPKPPPELAQEVHKPPAPAAPVETAKSQEKLQEVVSKAPIDRTLPESLIAAPAKDLAARSINYGTMLSSRAANSKLMNNWQYRRTRQGQIVGFEFSNHGGNPMLTPRRDATKNQFFTRDFQFRFDDRARQDIHLMISDWVASRDRVFRLSELMHRLMHFFPRSYLPAIVNAGDNNIVTLPTGEEVRFDALTKEIRGGVFTESPVDLSPDRTDRKFPTVTYQGQGVLVRADARGADPRLGTTATISAGTPPSSCDKPEGCRQCEVPSKELWDQSGAVRFKFQTDQEFDRYLTARCGFGLPRLGTEFAVTAPQS
jgi:hypothetical protein